MLQLVEEVGEEALDPLTARARHVEDAHTHPLVEGDGEEHDAERRDDDRDVHRDDGCGLTDAVTQLVLTRGGVDAESDTEHRSEDGGADHELCGHPHAVGDLVVHRLTDGALAPVPAEEDAAEPGPPSLDQRDGVAQIERLQHPGDLVGTERGASSDVIAPGIQEAPRQEVGDVGRNHDHEQPADRSTQQILDQGDDSFSCSDALGICRRNAESKRQSITICRSARRDAFTLSVTESYRSRDPVSRMAPGQPRKTNTGSGESGISLASP
ncbi:hypothetical protein SRABI44_03153 [Microbacterium foliorum]|nr:hypothetical protein SRABI03_02896 [Microbacterium foliorum]CAH0250919.1 hypothetical protein SRABI44_03153 [Microbacterium foliorum]